VALTSDFVDLLRSRLKEPRLHLPGRTMAPELSYGRHAGPVGSDARQAAVLVLLFPGVDGRWQLLMTIRAAEMTSHAGQVSFPGGKVEAGETPEQAALREYEEELGTLPVGLEIVGRLASVFVFVSNFDVTPVVAIAQVPPELRPNPGEVAGVITIPWEVLAEPATRQEIRIERRGLSFVAPCYRVEGFSIWGATAIMLEEMLGVLAD
jgi:8-oxo-dGTP pyrophosphatase MutT (NUDIX family)